MRAAGADSHGCAVRRDERRRSAPGCSTVSRGVRARNGTSAGRAFTAFSTGSNASATRPTSGFCWPNTGASCPAPHAAAPSSRPMRSTSGSTARRSPPSGAMAVRDLPGVDRGAGKQRRGRPRRGGVLLRELNEPRRLSQRGRAWLPDARAAGAHALGRRGAADSSGERARQTAVGHALRAGRANGRPARRRLATAARRCCAICATSATRWWWSSMIRR